MKNNQAINIAAISQDMSEHNFTRTKELLRDKRISIEVLGTAIRKLCHSSNTHNDIEFINFLSNHVNDINALLYDHRHKAFTLPILYLAVQTQQIELVKLLVARGAQINGYDRSVSPLYSAIESGNIEIVEFLLENGANINPSLQHMHDSPLYIAAKKGDLSMVKFLVTREAGIQGADKDLYPPLYGAVEGSKTEIVAFLLEQDAKINPSLRQMRDSPFTIAAKKGDGPMVELLLSHGATDFSTALHAAVQGNHVNVIEILLHFHPEIIEEKGQHGNSALHLAVKTNKIQAMIALLEHNASITSKDSLNLSVIHTILYEHYQPEMIKLLINQKMRLLEPEQKLLAPYEAIFDNNLKIIGKTLPQFIDSEQKNSIRPLHVAVLHFGPKNAQTQATKLAGSEVMQQLLSAGFDINALDKNQASPLHLAAMNGWTELVNFLLQNQANAELIDNNRYNALHYAVLNGHESTVLSLLQNCNIDINAQTQEDNTALHLAVRTGNIPILELLLRNGANINAPGPSNQTPLHIAVDLQSTSLIQTLLEHSADINAQDQLKQTPLALALTFQNFSIAELLISRRAEVELQYSFDVLKNAIIAKNKDLVESFNYKEWYHQDQVLELMLLSIDTPFLLSATKAHMDYFDSPYSYQLSCVYIEPSTNLIAHEASAADRTGPKFQAPLISFYAGRFVETSLVSPIIHYSSNKLLGHKSDMTVTEYYKQYFKVAIFELFIKASADVINYSIDLVCPAITPDLRYIAIKLVTDFITQNDKAAFDGTLSSRDSLLAYNIFFYSESMKATELFKNDPAMAGFVAGLMVDGIYLVAELGEFIYEQWLTTPEELQLSGETSSI